MSSWYAKTIHKRLLCIFMVIWSPNCNILEDYKILWTNLVHYDPLKPQISSYILYPTRANTLASLTLPGFKVVIPKDNWGYVYSKIWLFEWLKIIMYYLVYFSPWQSKIGIHCPHNMLCWFVQITSLVMCGVYIIIFQKIERYILKTISMSDNLPESADIPSPRLWPPRPQPPLNPDYPETSTTQNPLSP